MGDHERTLHYYTDDLGMKTELILNLSGGTFGTLRFDEKSFFNTLLGFTPYWDYKPNNAIHTDSPGEYTSDKVLNLSTKDEIHLKCDCITGSVINGVRQPVLYRFNLNNSPGFKLFCEPETIHYRKVNKFVLNSIAFYLDNVSHEEVNYIGDTVTFTLQLIKISTLKGVLKNLNIIYIASDKSTTPVQKTLLVRYHSIKKLVERLNY